MKPTWILVSNGSRARVLWHRSQAGPLEEIHASEHPACRARNLDISTDKPGRTQHSSRNGSRGSKEPRQYPKETERVAFARELVDYLAQQAGRGAYDRLMLVAPPHFLGLLRELLPDLVAHRLAGSLDKDLTQLTPGELQDCLALQLAQWEA